MPTLFSTGIIDAVTKYDAKKRAAHAAKTVMQKSSKSGDSKGLSTVNPEQVSEIMALLHEPVHPLPRKDTIRS